MTTQSPKTSPSAYETANRYVAASSEKTSSWSLGTSSVEVDAPDFDAIPRDKTGARAAAVLALYEADLTNRPAIQCMDWIATEIRLSRKLRKFAILLASSAENRRPELDRRLNRYSRRSTMAEILPVIRNILRIALVEMELNPETSPAIIISEAVKLSQTFDTHGSGRYVNGILGAIVRDDLRE